VEGPTGETRTQEVHRRDDEQLTATSCRVETVGIHYITYTTVYNIYYSI